MLRNKNIRVSGIRSAGSRTISERKTKIAIVVSSFNDDITENLLKGALGALSSNGVLEKNINTFWVPGSYEIPLSCQKLAKTKKYDALLALGCVIKGETDHYHYIAKETSRGVMDVMLEYSLPIGFGIITTNNLRQAKARSGVKNNKGAEAAQAVLEMIREFY